MEVIEFAINTIEIAEIMEISHWELLRKLEGRTGKDGKHIKGYLEILAERHMSPSDFFILSTYKDSSGKENKCYKVTKKGCEFLANKFTGEKGVIFTACYINRFHEMESIISSQSPAVAPVQPEKMEQIEKEYADLKKEIRGIKSDLKRIGRSGGLQTVAYSGRWQYKDWIIKILYVIDESEDERFLRQMYTIFKRHLERKNDFRWRA